MTVKPILFSGAMVRALLEGRKTQTRRVLKPQPDPPPHWDGRIGFSFMRPERHYEMRGWTKEDGPLMRHRPLPYWNGDLLWVRETWCSDQHAGDANTNPKGVRYRATDDSGIEGVDDGDGYAVLNKDGSLKSPWRPSIHMPRWASRLTLEVTNVKVERLQDISEEDAKAEGCDKAFLATSMRDVVRKLMGVEERPSTYRCGYAHLWDQINGKGAWEANPWVVAVSFRVHACNVDEIPSANKLGKAA